MGNSLSKAHEIVPKTGGKVKRFEGLYPQYFVLPEGENRSHWGSSGKILIPAPERRNGQVFPLPFVQIKGCPKGVMIGPRPGF
jgi:hypothetical protein